MNNQPQNLKRNRYEVKLPENINIPEILIKSVYNVYSNNPAFVFDLNDTVPIITELKKWEKGDFSIELFDSFGLTVCTFIYKNAVINDIRIIDILERKELSSDNDKLTITVEFESEDIITSYVDIEELQKQRNEKIEEIRKTQLEISKNNLEMYERTIEEINEKIKETKKTLELNLKEEEHSNKTEYLKKLEESLIELNSNKIENEMRIQMLQ